MKAVVVTGPGQWEWADIPLPKPAANEALVRIEACGFCNSTDAELVEGTQPYRPAAPFVLGHESVGTVLEVGSAVTKYRVGDKVTRAAAIMPGDQRDGLSSGWGGFAEYGLVRDDPGNYTSQRQIVLPADVEPETAFMAISLAETRAFVDQVQEATGNAIAGAPAIVVGTGIAGLTLTHWLREVGAAPVITVGRRPERLVLARRSGAHLALSSGDADFAARIFDRSGGRLAPLLFEAIGKPAELPRFVPLLEPDAVVAVYGAASMQAYQESFQALPAGLTVLKPGPEEHRYTRAMAELLHERQVSPNLWRTHLWTPDEFGTALAQVAAGEVVKGCVRFR